MRGTEHRADSTGSNGLQVYVENEENRAVEIRRIGILIDAWLMPQYQDVPDLGAARRGEVMLHAAIKTSSLYGKILNFAGLNIWVDDRTPDGVVESQEAINL